MRRVILALLCPIRKPDEGVMGKRQQLGIPSLLTTQVMRGTVKGGDFRSQLSISTHLFTTWTLGPTAQNFRGYHLTLRMSCFRRSNQLWYQLTNVCTSWLQKAVGGRKGWIISFPQSFHFKMFQATVKYHYVISLPVRPTQLCVLQ